MTDEPATDDPFAELRARIQDAKQAAERLHRETDGARDAAASGVPLRGWATPEDRQDRAHDARALAELITALRELVPEELLANLNDLIRQLLLLARAIIVWAVERMTTDRQDPSPSSSGGSDIEDIPVT
ncbi:MAG: hypothetical protein WC558_09685 [Patulibacter sp.]